MHLPIKGLVIDAIPACNAVKTILIEEAAEAQKDEREMVETSLVL